MVITSNNESILKDAMYNRISEELSYIRSGKTGAKRIILLVPAQSTLRIEEECFARLSGSGFFDLLVMSGAKLREEIMKECGRPGRTSVNTVGRKLILRKLAKENASKLNSFKSLATEDGFIDMMADFMVQLKHNAVSPEEVEKAFNSAAKSSILSSKLSDLKLMYGAYEAYLEGKYTDSDDLISFATSKISESEYIKNSVIWYYDFYSFTNSEYAFLDQLNTYSKQLNFAILADNDKYKCGMDTALKISKKLSQSVENCFSPDSRHVCTKIVSCASVYSQSQTIANDILKNVRENKWGYDDFVVLSQDENSRENLKRVFHSLSVPYFMDEKRTFDRSALASFVTDLLNVLVNDFRPSDVISLVKSELLGFDNNEINDFVNYVTQYKIYKKAFLDKFKYGKNKSCYTNAEKIRGKFAALISYFENSISGAKTAEDYTIKLYDLLSQKLNVANKLENLASSYELMGCLDTMQETTQSWDLFAGLLDQLVELVGNDEMSLRDYSDILTSSFSDIKIGVLPQAEGKVSIGSVTRSGFSDVKALYIADFNDEILPSDGISDALFTDREISDMASMGMELTKSCDLIKSEELFQIERALDTDCQQLMLLYTASDIDGGERLISPMLTGIADRDSIAISEDIDNSSDGLGYLQSPESAASRLLQFLKIYLSGEEIPEDWKLCANLLKDDNEFLLSSKGLFFSPGKEVLDSESSDKLFSKSGDCRYSPSQLEIFAACPFKHYMEYGLRPDKRERFQIDSGKSGTIYHEVLQKLSKRLSNYSEEADTEITDKQSMWMKVTDEEITIIVDEILDDIKKDDFDGLLLSGPEEEYRFRRIRALSLVFAKYMVEQLRKGVVSKMYFERSFGKEGELPPLYIDTKFGKLRIEGIIDRTDIINNGKVSYAKIIDYKSGSKEFNMERLELGLDLQLMIYLEAATNDQNLEAGAVFYYLVHNPDFDGKLEDVLSGVISEDLEKKFSQKYALDGVVLKNDVVLSSIDTHITNTDDFKTNVIKTKSGKALLTESEFSKLRTDFRITLTKLCEELKSGMADVRPTIYKGENAGCEYCDYASVCVKDFAYK